LATLQEIHSVVAQYGVVTVYSDQWSVDSLRDLAAPFGLHIVEDRIDAARKQAVFETLRVKLEAGRVTLPNNRAMLEDIRRVTRRVTQNGVAIDLPHTADGRHCDYAPCVAMAVDWARVGPENDNRKGWVAATVDDYLYEQDDELVDSYLEDAVGYEH
jgi:hypothetical protein